MVEAVRSSAAGRAGFTLIEMLVALAVFALAAMALYRDASASLSSSSDSASSALLSVSPGVPTGLASDRDNSLTRMST